MTPTLTRCPVHRHLLRRDLGETCTRCVEEARKALERLERECEKATAG